MARIVIHLPYARRCLRPMAALAMACRASGHQVRFWLGGLARTVPNRWWIGSADLALVWNGKKPRYEPGVRTLRAAGAKIIYVEHGWHPQGPTVQMDPVGINAGASWAGARLTAPKRTPLAVRERGDLLLVLQHDRDVQIQQYSPWFADMRALVEHVLAHSSLPVRVRAHPRHRPHAALRALVQASGHAWDDSPSLAVALETCRAVACVNSSSAIEALDCGLPVLCFGEAVYRQRGAVHCLDNDPLALQAVTADLLRGQSALFVERVAETLAMIRQHQYSIDRLSQTLPALIDRWLLSAALSPAVADKPTTLRAA